MDRRNWLRNSLMATAGLSAFPGISVLAKQLNFNDFEAEELIRLSSNENPYGPSKKVREAIMGAITEANRYAFHLESDLQKMIADREKVAPESVVLSHGSSEILHLAARLYGSDKQEVVVPSLTFFMFEKCCRLLGGNIKQIDLNDAHEINLEAMEQATGAGTKLVYICNPNNPTGTVIQSSYLKDFCESVSTKATVLVDEAYIEFCRSAYYGSMIDLVRKEKNVIICRTFSKIHGLAGMRIGYAIAKPEIARKLSEIKLGILSHLGIVAAMTAYKDHNFVEETNEKNEIAKNYLYEELNKMKVTYVKAAANFVYANVGMDYGNFKNNLAMLQIQISGRENTNWARFTIGTKSEMEKLVSGMRNVLKK